MKFIVFLCSAGWRLEGVEATTERGTQTVWRVGWISPFAAGTAPRLLGFRSVASLLSTLEEPHWRSHPSTSRFEEPICFFAEPDSRRINTELLVLIAPL